MASVFTKIIEGELPGRFVWRDERCVAFLSINPLRPGHTLVVPIEEVDHWLDLDPELNAHLLAVGQKIGQAQMAALSPTRVGVIVAGMEVPHMHLHIVPIDRERDLDFANAARQADPAEMDQARDAIVAALRDAGHDPGV